ncbi:hypothetical protein NDU88_005313 [Pleurodeles waltl]|uniref:Uncharacterized protein n=1 Tax=Pleurodeles waltl TaxID=8319 RepID=A0AAV7ULR0_PLEWA|nr:hypothetical protein NDU88_005313 [Pleurodeles waltl]
MLESPRGTQRNLFDASVKDHAYVTQGAVSPGYAGREEKESGNPGELGRHEAGVEPESQGAAARNGESRKASQVPGALPKLHRTFGQIGTCAAVEDIIIGTDYSAFQFLLDSINTQNPMKPCLKEAPFAQEEIEHTKDNDQMTKSQKGYQKAA